MSTVNKVILVGHLGKDPEVRHLESGAVVANFPLATSERYTDKSGQKVEKTEWHNIVLWRGLAEVAEKYLQKGKLVYIEGKLRTRSYDQDGVTKYITEVMGDNMTMLGKREDNVENVQRPVNTEQQPAAEKVQPSAEQQNVEDDLPF